MSDAITDRLADPTRPTRLRYWVVLLAMLMAILLYLDRICLSFTEQDMKKDLQLNDVQMSWVLSAFFLTYALGQVPAGWLSDRFGARRMLTLYILSWSVFTGLLGLAGTFLGLLVLRFGIGLAQAGAYPTSANLISKWVPFAGRGLASGVVSTGGRIGGVAAPVLTAYLMVAFASLYVAGYLPWTSESWRPTMIVYGLMGLVVAALFWVIVRDGPHDHPSCNAAELEVIEEGRPATTGSPHGRATGLPLAAMLTSTSLWCSSIQQFTTNFGWVFLITYLPRYLAEAHQVPIVERGWMAGTPIFLGLFGMLAGGWLTDRLTRRLGLRWGRALPMSLTRFAAMAAYLACLLLDSPWEVTIALCLVALSVDLGTASVWAFMQDIGGRHVGSVLGWGNMWGNFGAAVSPLVLNQVIGSDGNWNACFMTCAGAFFISGLAGLGVDATRPITPPERPMTNDESPMTKE